jgi:HAMP domain-containing protein
MLKSLTNLSIRRKFAVAIIPLLLIIVIFDFLQIQHNYRDYHDSRRLNKAIIVGIEINHVVHELQKERGITAGYLSNQGENFASDLDIQRKTTDSTMRAYYNELEMGNLDDLLELHGKDLESLNLQFEKLERIREQVDNLSISSDQSIAFYSELNTVALSTVNNLINETRDRTAAQQVHAIIYFLKAKERASIERAIGTQAFGNKGLNNTQHAQISSLVSAQNAYMDAFMTITNEESRDFYRNTVSGPEVDEVERMELLLLANENLQEDPNYWYEMITKKIDLLKKAEDFMSDNIHAYTEKISAESNRKFWTFIVVDVVVGSITLLLIGFIISNLIKNVKTLEAFTVRVSKGDFTKKVNIPTKDEIGQYAKTFNVMVAQIYKYNKALRRQKNKAQFLYEKVYKQYEVVFDNVEQGIFLLDRNFRISKLYSKAMERIFDNKKIAGEEFSNFMRTRLIPRDLEALEMFMKHLFNPDIDEEVLNQLNPVEQVKIFTEAKGVINTKYIKFAFTRIEKKGEIISIMVTVLDETESVLLQQHLEEVDEQKKVEMEQLLSILKIDPSVLRGFIHNSRKVLKGISDRYENDKEQDFNLLLDFTYKTIHTLKGNAMVIGLDLVSDKFHDIEESINKLKDKKISGSDFLTILYEINESDAIIARMGDMLSKVASVYSNFGSSQTVDANFAIIDSLKRGIDKMSEENGKAAELVFKNERNITIPDNLEQKVQDILIQLIRNSIAHGIELPNERVAKKKLIKGTIAVQLEETENDEMRITYSDDGAGVDRIKILRKAVDNEFISKQVAEELSDGDVAKLLFEDGFSTAEKIDNYSGRGQGMPLVKSIIEECEGTFEVTFKKDEFFKMIIVMPLSKTESVA